MTTLHFIGTVFVNLNVTFIFFVLLLNIVQSHKKINFFLIFKQKKDVRNRSSYGGEKLLQHAMKIVEKVMKRFENYRCEC